MKTNISKALDFGISLIGTPYGYWEGGECQKGAPMFAQNGVVPDKNDIVSLNCAGLCNVMLRSIGKDLPISVKDNTVGGTEAYYDYYDTYEKLTDFSMNETYPIGTLLIRKFRDINDQGHVAVIIENKGKTSKVLQSHVDGEFHKSVLPGVNSIYTLEESHNAFTDEKGNGCCYEKVVLPENWLL